MGTAFNRVDERRRSLRQFAEAMTARPLLSLGFGLYWMQTILLFQSPYLALDPSPLAGASLLAGLPKGTALLVASVVAYTLWGLRFRRANALSQARWYFPALCSALVLGALLYCLYPQAGALAVPTYLLGSVLIGGGTAHICLETGRVFGTLGPLNVLFHGIVSLLIGTLGAFALSFAPALVSKAVLVLLPVPMVACLWRTMAGLPRRELYERGLDVAVQLPTKFLVTSLFQGLALGVMHCLLIDDFGSSALVVSLGYLAAVALLLFCAIAVKNNFDILIYRIGFPLMAGGFFVVGLCGLGGLPYASGALLLDAGYGFQYLMTCSLCSYLAKGLGQPPVWIVGLGTACLLAGQLVGSVLDVLVADQVVLAVSVSFFLMLAALIMTSGKNLRLGWGAVRPGADDAMPAGVHRSTLAACQLLASECGLSPRETDVMVQTVRGFSRRAVAQELCLSEETVKTHLGRVYQKTQVHARQELIELVARREAAMGE